MNQHSFSQLLRFSQQLQSAVSYDELVETVRAEIAAATGYQHAWLYVFDEKRQFSNCVALSAELQAQYGAAIQAIPVAGDQLSEQVIRGEGPVVVEDAFTDERTKDQPYVHHLHNRTIISIPLVLVDGPLGCLGTGTYGGPEAIRPPTVEQLEYLVALAGHVALAAARIRLLAERQTAERERERMFQRLYAGQRLETLGLIAGGVAHDFNNLLHITGINLSVLQEAPDESTRASAAAAIRFAIQSGADLTKRLLAFVRRRQTLPQRWEFNIIVGETCRLLKPLLSGSVELEVRLADDAGCVNVDRSQIEQVVMNLLLNARDAIPGSGKILVQTESRGPSTQLTVTDTGVGMTPEVRAQLFEPFFTTKPPGQGTGLGLATVRHILDEYAARIEIESTPARGTRIKVLFPRCDVPIPHHGSTIGDVKQASAL